MSAHRSISSNESSNVSNNKPKRYTNPWRKQRSIPRTIDFTSDTEFPPLPTNKKQKSTTSITTEEQTNNDTSQKSTKADGDTLTVIYLKA